MLSVRILFCLFCTVAVIGSRGIGSGVVGDGTAVKGGAEKVIAIAQKEIGVRESSTNAGDRVDQYNVHVGFRKVAWCSSFVSWCFGQAGYPQPRTAWSPALFSTDRLAKDPVAGMVIGIYFQSLGRIAHCGVLEKVSGDWCTTIEGNSSPDGSREGTGVFRRMRHKRTISKFADWIKQ